MSNITLERISKSFGKTNVLKNINLNIKDKEFFVIFGPAGAGKTSLLNIIAGLYIPDEGNLLMNNNLYNIIEPEERNVAMVFENYALYPHLTVYENIASSMRSPKYRQKEEMIKEKVTRVAKTLNIDWLLDRQPSELSNGQRQRVALGRALVRDPQVFLMDEPLTHLDAKLRNQMRAELKEMQASLETTTIYVTHDYLEALSLGDRIAVIDEGKIVQVGTPHEIYYYPETEFVAESFGEPEINILDAKVVEKNNKRFIEIEGILIEKDKSNKILVGLPSTKELRIGFRPTDISYSLNKEGEQQIPATVYSFESLGFKAILTVKVFDHLIRITTSPELDVKINQELYITLEIESALFFDKQSKKLIRPLKN